MALSFSLKLMLMKSTQLSASEEVEWRNPDADSATAEEERKSTARKREICFLQSHFYIFMTLTERNRCQDE